MVSKSHHRGEVYEGPDSQGRYHYDYHPGHPLGEHGWRERGQHFFAVPPKDKGIQWDDKR